MIAQHTGLFGTKMYLCVLNVGGRFGCAQVPTRQECEMEMENHVTP